MIFAGALLALLTAFLYDQSTKNGGNAGSLNEFLRIVSNGGRDVQLTILNREYAQYSQNGVTKSFPIGSIDQVEESIRAIQDKNDVPFENRCQIIYQTTFEPWKTVANNFFLIGFALFLLYSRARGKGGFGASFGPPGAAPRGGAPAKGKKGKKSNQSASPFDPMGQMNNVKKSTAVVIEPEDIEVRFDDVAGCEESKEEIMELVSFLKNPDDYAAIGAKIPKGAILNGPPGTGKTLLGKATAGEVRIIILYCLK